MNDNLKINDNNIILSAIPNDDETRITKLGIYRGDQFKTSDGKVYMRVGDYMLDMNTLDQCWKFMGAMSYLDLDDYDIVSMIQKYDNSTYIRFDKLSDDGYEWECRQVNGYNKWKGGKIIGKGCIKNSKEEDDD